MRRIDGLEEGEVAVEFGGGDWWWCRIHLCVHTYPFEACRVTALREIKRRLEWSGAFSFLPPSRSLSLKHPPRHSRQASMTHIFTAVADKVAQLATSSQTLSTSSPITGDVVVTRSYPSTEALETAVQNSNAAYLSWRKVSSAERKRLVSAGVEHLAARAAELGPELTEQMGRPARYTASEFSSFQDRANWLINKAEKALADENVDEGRPDGFKRIIRRAPVGVCLLVGAWNARLPFFFLRNEQN